MKATEKNRWLNVFLFVLLFSCFASLPAHAGTWQEDQYGWWYLEDDGSYPRNGWKEINGNWFYFYSTDYIAQETRTPDGYYVDSNGCYIDISKKYNVANQLYGFETIVLEVGTYSGDGRLYAMVLIDRQESWYGEESEVLACGGYGVEVRFHGVLSHTGESLSLSWILDDPSYGVYVKGGGLPEAQYAHVRALYGN